jgi:hypothetical protein
MRKSTLLFVVASLISIGALAASEEGKPAAQQPGAGKETPAFSLTQGYFSIFSLFVDTPFQQSRPDTIRKTVPMPRIKEDTRKPR